LNPARTVDIVNRMGIAASASPAMAADGTPLLVLVAKASFELPASGCVARLAQEQLPIQEVDEFESEPGLSPPRLEADTAPYKPRCDIVLTGSAYAQGRTAARGVEVGLQVGSLRKVLEVWGARQWQRTVMGLGAWTLSDAQPFERLALSYALAYGGSHINADKPGNPDGRQVWHANPVGVGFYTRHLQLPADQPAAHTQWPGQHPADPWTPQPSLSFGPVGRNWQPRLQHAGTFDDGWQQQRFPLLPEDFNPQHWQLAPLDQQVEALRPGMPVQLWNLTPDGYWSFELPALSPQVRFTRGGRVSARPMRADTLLLEPDGERFSLVWRTHWPLLRSQPPLDRLELHHA